MRVLLIDVPFDEEDIGGERRLFAGVENVIPSLGLAYLAAVAEVEGHDARILDCARGLPFAEIRGEVRRFRPQVVGLGVTTPTFLNALRAADLVRREAPDAVLVAGGAHPTAMPEHTAASGAFDFLVQGEGEGPFAGLLRHLDGGGDAPEAIPGIGFFRDGSLVQGPPAKPIADLDTIPLPARHLLPPLDAYAPCPASYRALPLAHVMTSRGCPSLCKFCDRAVFGERYRERGVGNVMLEVEEVVRRYGAKEIRFFDDTFTVNRRRIEALCDELERFRPRLIWTCLTKVDNVTPGLLKRMRSAGCWQVLYGLESGDDGILRSLGKRTTVEQNRQAVRWAREAGLRVRADFLVGSPDETPETLQRTLDLARELSIDFAHFNKFVPFPGTDFYRQLIAEGYEFDFSSSSTLAHDAMVYVPPSLDTEEYGRFLDRSYRQFYFRPRYLARRITGIRTWTELRGNLLGSLSIGSI